jgi:hypothetical protein
MGKDLTTNQGILPSLSQTQSPDQTNSSSSSSWMHQDRRVRFSMDEQHADENDEDESRETVRDSDDGSTSK